MPMAMMQAQEDTDDDISKYFYKSSPEGLGDSTNSISSRVNPAFSSSVAAGRPQPTTTATNSGSKTTDDVLTSVYRPLLMTGTTPNSTSSIFCRNTACNPDADQIILCMSSVLQVQMLHDKQAGANEALRERFRVFEAPVTARVGVLGGGGRAAAAAAASSSAEGGEGMMVVEEEEQQQQQQQQQQQEEGQEEEVTVEEIHRFIEGIFKKSRFSPECNIIALVYINRVISTTSLPLHARNWKSVVLVALLLAQKVWDDRCVALSSFSQHLPDFPLERMRLVERKFLELLQYRATVSQALYTRYYFELRALFEKLLEQESVSREFPLKPMAMWQARKLELCSDSFGLRTRGASSNSNINPASISMSGGPAGGGGRPPYSSNSASSTLPTRLLTGVQPHSPLEPFATTAAGGGSGGGGGGAAAPGSGPLRSSLLGLPPPAPSSKHPSTSSLPSSSLSTTSSTSSSSSRGVRKPRNPTASGIALNSPWTPLPQSPSPTYEDVTYMPKGRYVQS